MTAAHKVHALIEKYFKPLVNTDGCASAAQAPGGICGVVMLTNRQGLAPEPAAVGLTEGLLAL